MTVASMLAFAGSVGSFTQAGLDIGSGQISDPAQIEDWVDAARLWGGLSGGIGVQQEMENDINGGQMPWTIGVIADPVITDGWTTVIQGDSLLA